MPPIIRFFFTALLFLLPVSSSAEQALRISAILSYDKPPYQQVLQGVRDFFQQRKIPAEIVSITPNNFAQSNLSKDIQAQQPQLLLSLGQQATQFVTEHFTDTPICASMILDDSLIKNKTNATAQTLSFSLATELEWMQTLLPEQHYIAVLYDPVKNQADLPQLKKLAEKYQKQLYLQAIDDNRKLPELLSQLPQNIDVLWSFTNSGILTAQTAKHILLYSFRNRIPLVGSSSQWVKAGALYALERDYQDIGRQCAEKLLRIAQGTSPRDILVTPPRTVLYSINKKTAQHMKIDLPSTLLDSAYEVY